MAKFLRQSTASQEITLGYFVDNADGNTEETGLTIANTDIKLRKGGATTLANKNSGGATHISNGIYSAVLDATDTDTLGHLEVFCHPTGAAAFKDSYEVLPAVVYDALVLGTDNLQVDLTQISGAAVSASSAQLGVNVVQISADATAADNLELAFDGTGYAGGSTPQQVVLTTSGRDAVSDAVWDEAMGGHTTVGSFGQRFAALQSGTAQAGSSSTTLVLASAADADNDTYNNALLVLTGGTGAPAAEYVSDYVGSTRTATINGSWKNGTPDATTQYVVLPGGALPGASAPTAGEVADAVWDEAASAHTTAGSFGQYVGAEVTRAGTAQAGTTSSITLDASASATNNLYRYHRVEIIGGTGAGQASYITGYTGSSKVATVDPAFTTAPASDSIYLLRKTGIDAATPAQVAAEVWDTARSGHATAGTFGEYVNADVTRISGDATAANNCESFFDGTGYAGTNNVLPSVTTVTGNVGGNVVGSVASVTGNVGGNVVGSVASVTGAVGSVTGNVGGNVVGSVGSLNTQAKADVNAEVVDALATDTYAELGAVPAATSSLKDKINWLFALARNKITQTATTQTLRNDADSGNIATSSTGDDGTTATRGEWS